MTPWQNRVTTLTERMADDMKLRNYSQKTIDTYTYHVGRFAQFVGKSLEQAVPEDVRSFQLHLIEERKVGWSSFNQAVCGLRFLFRTTYPRSWAVSMVPFGKKPKTLPTVLGGEEVTSLLSCVKSLKHRTFLLTLYAAGLRLNEAAELTIADIDSHRMQLQIAHPHTTATPSRRHPEAVRGRVCSRLAVAGSAACAEHSGETVVVSDTGTGRTSLSVRIVRSLLHRP